jgi:hypothetical protein
MQSNVRDSTTSSEPVLRHVQDRKHLQLNVLRRKSGDVAVETLDYQVADLRKKLNRLRYETKQRASRVDGLVREYGKVCEMNAEKVIFIYVAEDANTANTQYYIFI